MNFSVITKIVIFLTSLNNFRHLYISKSYSVIFILATFLLSHISGQSLFYFIFLVFHLYWLSIVYIESSFQHWVSFSFHAHTHTHTHDTFCYSIIVSLSLSLLSTSLLHFLHHFLFFITWLFFFPFYLYTPMITLPPTFPFPLCLFTSFTTLYFTFIIPSSFSLFYN